MDARNKWWNVPFYMTLTKDRIPLPLWQRIDGSISKNSECSTETSTTGTSTWRQLKTLRHRWIRSYLHYGWSSFLWNSRGWAENLDDIAEGSVVRGRITCNFKRNKEGNRRGIRPKQSLIFISRSWSNQPKFRVWRHHLTHPQFTS